MAKIISFGKSERMIDRDAAEAIAELGPCTADLTNSLGKLAKQYPGAFAFGAIIGGKPHGVFVMSGSRQGNHFGPAAENRMQVLALIVDSLPDVLRSAFENEWIKLQADKKAPQSPQDAPEDSQ